MDTTIQCLSHEGVASKRALPPYCRATPSSVVMSHLWDIQTAAAQQSKAHLDVNLVEPKSLGVLLQKGPRLKRVEKTQAAGATGLSFFYSFQAWSFFATALHFMQNMCTVNPWPKLWTYKQLSGTLSAGS